MDEINLVQLLEVAEGMSYLHTFDPVIVYADIRGVSPL